MHQMDPKAEEKDQHIQKFSLPGDFILGSAG